MSFYKNEKIFLLFSICACIFFSFLNETDFENMPENSMLSFKNSFEPANKIKLSPLNNLISTENKCDAYCIPWYCNLSCIGHTRKILKYIKINEYRRKTSNQKIYNVSVVSHFWSYNHYFDFPESNIYVFSFFFFHSDLHKNLYTFKKFSLTTFLWHILLSLKIARLKFSFRFSKIVFLLLFLSLFFVQIK